MRHGKRALGAAAVGSMALLLAACNLIPGKSASQPQPSDASPSSSAAASAPLHLLLSDGSDTVIVDGQPVTFPTTVTDAAWSPDGSRVAFIGGAGNVASTRPDGTDLIVYTATDSSVTRSHPTWAGGDLVYAETNADGTSGLKQTLANAGSANLSSGIKSGDLDYDTGAGTSYVDLDPSSRVVDLNKTYLAFEHVEPSGHEVWLIDDNGRGQVVHKIANGSQPGLSPDGSKLAYVGSNGQLFVQTLAKDAPSGPAVQVTFDAPPSWPVFAPDGTHLIFNTPVGVEEVPIDVAAGATSNPATQLSNHPAIPSVAGRLDSAVRIAAADPVAEAIAASRATFKSIQGFPYATSYGGVDDAILASTDPSSWQRMGTTATSPLLLTDPNTLDPRVVDEFHRLWGNDLSHVTIHADGLSDAVVTQLTGLGFEEVYAGRGGAPHVVAGPVDRPYEVTFVDSHAAEPERSLAFSITLDTTDGDDPQGPTIPVDTSAAIPDDLADWLTASSTSINRVVFVGTVPDSFVAQVEALVSGPFGYDSVTNPDPVGF